MGWAALSPLLALYLRNAYILIPSRDGIIATATYCLICFIASLVAFATFRVHAGLEIGFLENLNLPGFGSNQ